LYTLLQVSPSASQVVIQAAYRALVRDWHPDVNATAEAAARIRELNAAYAVLSDPFSRAQYDLERARWRRRERIIRRTKATPPTVAPRVRTVVVVSERGGVRRLTPERLPVYSSQFMCLVAIVAAIIAALVLLVWIALSTAADDEPPPLAMTAALELLTG
jgi:hypothetical protein